MQAMPMAPQRRLRSEQGMSRKSISPRTDEAAMPEPVAANRQLVTIRGARVGAVSGGALALGAFALGAIAMGAVAIGAMAIGRLSIGKLHLREARIDRLRVGSLEIDAATIGSEEAE
ncbi:hypothetical protein GCM10009127_06810 [Alteraurantiacibacter aestuarii]